MTEEDDPYADRREHYYYIHGPQCYLGTTSYNNGFSTLEWVEGIHKALLFKDKWMAEGVLNAMKRIDPDMFKHPFPYEVSVGIYFTGRTTGD